MVTTCLIVSLLSVVISAQTGLNNTFKYNLTSNNENRALLALQSNAFSALYGSLALNETYPNIVYYGVGLDAGVLAVRLNAFMNNTETNDRVFVNATIYPDRLIEYDQSGQPTDNQIVFSGTSTGWSPIGTGILSLSNTTLLPPDLLTDNATIINALWTGPQRNELGQNVTAQFNIFLAPSIEAMGRMMMNDTKLNKNNQNITGLITALTVSNFPFQANGTVALRNIVKINETIYSVDQIIPVDITKTVPFLSFDDKVISGNTFMDRNVLNLVRNFSRTQLDRIIVIGSTTDNSTGNSIILEGIAVDLGQVQSVLPKSNAGSSLSRRQMWLSIVSSIFLTFFIQLC